MPTRAKASASLLQRDGEGRDRAAVGAARRRGQIAARRRLQRGGDRAHHRVVRPGRSPPRSGAGRPPPCSRQATHRKPACLPEQLLVTRARLRGPRRRARAPRRSYEGHCVPHSSALGSSPALPSMRSTDGGVRRLAAVRGAGHGELCVVEAELIGRAALDQRQRLQHLDGRAREDGAVDVAERRRRPRRRHRARRSRRGASTRVRRRATLRRGSGCPSRRTVTPTIAAPMQRAAACSRGPAPRRHRFHLQPVAAQADHDRHRALRTAIACAWQAIASLHLARRLRGLAADARAVARRLRLPVRPAARLRRRQRARRQLRRGHARRCARAARTGWPGAPTSTPGATRGRRARACRIALSDRASTVLPTSALQTRYVPVGLMYYEGIQRLLASGVTIAGLHAGDPDRVAARSLSAPARALADRMALVQEPGSARTARSRARASCVRWSSGTERGAFAPGDRRRLAARVAHRRRERRPARRRAVPGAGGAGIAPAEPRPARVDRSRSRAGSRTPELQVSGSCLGERQDVARSQPRRTAALKRSQAEPGWSRSQRWRMCGSASSQSLSANWLSPRSS